MSKYSKLIYITFTSLFLLNSCSNKKAGDFISDASWQKATNEAHLKYAKYVKSSLTPYFLNKNLQYPPQEIAMLTFKKEQIMELWAKDNNTLWQHIRDYQLTAYSGELGPKLRRNDGQIPEGVYKITRFNPFSTQHLSMMLNYPNQFDRNHALIDGRIDLGDNIFIHGKSKSVGCLAVGDKAIDELFVLVHQVGKENTKIIIAPNDLRKNQPTSNKDHHPKWLPSLYSKITNQLQPFVES